jgi:hypothetical protein
MKKQIFGLTCILLLASLVVLICNRIKAPYRNAERISKELRSSAWLNANNEVVKTFSHDFGGTFDCKNELCETEIHEKNSLLSFLKLAPPMDFRVLMHTSDNKMRDYSVTLRNNGQSGSSVWFVKAFDRAAFDMENEAFRVSAGDGRAPFVMVAVNLSAPDEQQILIQKIDLRCLSRMGGCTGQQLGPDIWRLAIPVPRQN